MMREGLVLAHLCEYIIDYRKDGQVQVSYISLTVTG